MARVTFMQEAGAASQTFRFEDEFLVVAQADDRTAGEFALGYLDLDLDALRHEPARRRLLRANRIYARVPLAAAKKGRTEIAIWRDAQAPAILAELTARWREARRRAVIIDFDAEPRAEMARFEALMGRGLVSAEEAAAAIARIAARASAALDQ